MPAEARPTAFDAGSGPERPTASGKPAATLSRPLIDGRFRLEAQLKSGPIEVWRATDRRGRTVAIKRVAPSSDAANWTAALKREFALVSRLQHPHVYRALEWIDDPAGAAGVFEYLAGGDLVSLAGASPRHWLRRLHEVLAAIGYLHGRGFVHRDIKARNVMIDTENRARLIDFGSAVPIGSRWSTAGTTAAHRRPGWNGRLQTAGDDIYAFAGLVYEMLYGQVPRPQPAMGASPGRADFGPADGESADYGSANHESANHESAAPGPAGRAAADLDSSLDELRSLVHETLIAPPPAAAGSHRDFSLVIESLLLKESESR